MNNLLFTALLIALLYYFFYYLPKRNKIEPDPKKPSSFIEPSWIEPGSAEIKFPSPETINCPEPKTNPQIEALTEELNLERNQRQELEKQITSLNASYKRLENTKNNQINKITQDLHKFQTKLNDLQKQLESKESKIKELAEDEKQLDILLKNIQDFTNEI